MAATTGVQEQRVLGDFLDMVRIDSPSKEEAAMAAWLEPKLREMGFEVSNDRTGPSTGNVIARLAGPAPSGPTIALSAHMDTVEPGRGIKPVVRDGVVYSSGDTILGSDCKAGIAAILEGVRTALEIGSPRPNLEIIFSWGEEGAHTGAKMVDTSNLRSTMCFILDAAGPVGKIVISAPAYHAIKARFIGKAAHAGVEPEAGINALLAASRAISRMPLGRIDHETTANVGLIRGGSGRNVVPEIVEIDAEARSRDNAKLAAQVEAMSTAMREEAERIGAQLELKVTPQYVAFKLAPESPVVEIASRAIQKLGLEPALGSSGGGSDANEYNEKGLPAVVLATGMTGAHTLQEHITVSDLVLLSRLVVEIMAEAALG